MIHVNDSEASTDGRALLFAEGSHDKTKGQEPAATILTGPRVGSQSSVSESFRLDGSAPEAPSESEGIGFESGRGCSLWGSPTF